MDPISEQRLARVNPALAGKVRAAMATLQAEGVFIRVASGLRTYAEQATIYAQGRGAPGHIVTDARAGYSNHNFGCAVDCYPFTHGESGLIDFEEHTPQFQAMVAAMKAQGLVWGGDWHSIHDAPHFQLANVPETPTQADREAFIAGGLPAVWSQYA